MNGGHDIKVDGNTATDTDPTLNGVIDRFLVFNNSGYNISITSNHVGIDGSPQGNIGEPATHPNEYFSGNPRNDPEMIVFEDYRKAFEGSVLAVGVSSSSSTTEDRRVIAIPTSELALFSSGQSGAVGGVLTILDGANAGTSIPVLQTFYSGESPSPTFAYFLLDSSLPQGTFDLDISPACVNTTIMGNMINTSGTLSTAIVLATTMIHASISGNTFEGDQSSEINGVGALLQSQAIRVELHGAKYSNSTGAESVSVVEASIDGNTIENSIGGVQMYLDLNSIVHTKYGRTYGFIDLENNNFKYTYQNNDIIGINDPRVVPENY